MDNSVNPKVGDTRKNKRDDFDTRTEVKNVNSELDEVGRGFDGGTGKHPASPAHVDTAGETGDVRFTAKRMLLVMTCTAAMILNIASATVVSIALPTIGRHFNVGPDELQWLVSAFSLSSGCLLIPFGRLADLHGRKRAFLIGNAWMAIFSLACGFAQSIEALDVLRGLQGLGAAATIPAALGILAHAFPPSRARSIAFATFSAGAPVGGAVGSQIGGVLTQYASATWRAPFYLTAGIGALVVFGGVYSIDADHPTRARHINTRRRDQMQNEVTLEVDRRVDWLGAFLVTAGLVLVTFVLAQGPVVGWKTGYIIALLIVGVLLVVAFLFWQRFLEEIQQERQRRRCPRSLPRSEKSHEASNETSTLPETNKRDQRSMRMERFRSRLPPPLMKLSLWTRARGKFAAMQGIAFLEWASFLSWTFWAQLYYQDYENLTPVLTAVRLLPMMIVGISCNFFVAMVVGHIPLVYLVVAGTTLTGCASLLFALINPSSPYWAFGFPAASLSVFGADFVFACGTLFVAKVSTMDEQSVAGGLFQTLTQLGTAFGLAITTIVHNSVLENKAKDVGVTLDSSQRGAPREVQLEAYKAAQWAGFGLAMLGAALALVFLRDVGVIGERGNRQFKDDKEAHEEDS